MPTAWPRPACRTCGNILECGPSRFYVVDILDVLLVDVLSVVKLQVQKNTWLKEDVLV